LDKTNKLKKPKIWDGGSTILSNSNYAVEMTEKTLMDMSLCWPHGLYLGHQREPIVTLSTTKARFVAAASCLVNALGGETF
jgi:hypothetical protein